VVRDRLLLALPRTEGEAMTNYTARARRSGEWWAVQIVELDHVFTQARRLDQVEAMARDAVALTLEVAPDSFDITVVPVLPADVGR
jgi:predicted RNase H-like HicB family nuclease